MTAGIDRLLNEWSTLVEQTKFRSLRRWVPDPVMSTGGILVPGASEDAIAIVEQRLGVSLPPSYRAFLRRSNGAYGGPVGLETKDLPLWQKQPENPTSLLPVEAIGWAAFDDPFSVDLSTELYDPEPLGHSTLFRSNEGEVAYLAAPWSSGHVELQRGQMYWSLRIGWVWDPATVVLLNPMVSDAIGEWELDVVRPDGVARYPSFAAWLEEQVETERSRRPDADDARLKLLDPDTSIHERLQTVSDLLVSDQDPDWLTANTEQAFQPGADASMAYRSWALTLLEWLDELDGGARFAHWVHQIVDSPEFDDLSVVEAVAYSAHPDVPRVGEILARQRPADQPHLLKLPNDALAEQYRAAPDPIVAGHLAQRGHPLVCDPVEIELRSSLLAPTHAASTTNEQRDGDQRDTRFSSDEIIAAAAKTDVPPLQVAEALSRAGYPTEAVNHLQRHRGSIDFNRRLDALGEIDTPASWEALDADAAPQSSIRDLSLLAAARTRSPSLAVRAAGYLNSSGSREDDRTRLMALLALEIQPVEAAADALLDAWREHADLSALRALGRRRDHRIVDDALLLLVDPDGVMRQVGAEVLRDLRVVSTVPALRDAFDVASDDEAVVILAHTLAMLQVDDAAGPLREKASTTTHQDLAQLLRRWADQLADPSGGT